jgi:hypothetical protein
MASGKKSECVIEVLDGLFQVIHPSQPLKSFEKSRRQVSQRIGALDIPHRQRTLLKVVSMLRNSTVHSFFLRLLNTPGPELAEV